MLRLVVTSVIFDFVLASPSPERHRLLDRAIIGGSSTKPDQFPYQLSLQHKKNHICGAALVSTKIAITAAHGTKNKKSKNLSVVAGTTNRYAKGKRSYVKRTEEHREFTPMPNSHDIAIVFLKASLKLGAEINVIALPEANEVIPADKYATVTGWGVDVPTGDDTGVNTKYLKFVRILIWERKRCLEFRQMLKSEVYCGGINSGLKNACAGDSGSPLVYRNKLFGVVAYGYGCGTPNKPSIYTNVAAHRNWITETAKL